MVFLYVITLTLVDVKEPSVFMLIFVISAKLRHMVSEAVLDVTLNRFLFRCLITLLSQKQCTKNNWLSKVQPTTCVKYDVLREKLSKHPDTDFVNFVCNGLEVGFYTLVYSTTLPTKECNI